MPSLNLRNPLRRDPNRPTLKQRAAALKATAGRLIQGKKPDPTAEALARMGPHWPGFLPYPTHAPKALLAVESVLENEAGRLLSIAQDEFARLYALQSEGLDEPGQEMLAARLRRRLRIDALTVAADPKGDAHEGGTHADLTMMIGGVVDDDGRVTFCDASGRVLRKPVADWIRFTASRLHHQAQREMARQINGSDLDQEEMQTHARELRRALRMDALNILAFRPGTACDLAEAAEADAFSGPIPTPDFTGWGPVSPDLLQAMEAHREARQLMLNDPDESDERTERGVARVDALAQAIRDVPARSAADLRCKMVYLWPGNLEGEEVSDGLAATFASFKQDVERLAATAPEVAVGADAELIALAEPWDAARRLYDQRTEEQVAVDKAARDGSSYPGPPPEGAGPDWLDWHRRINVFREESGINDAEGASNDALDDLAEIEDRVAGMQAHTLAGLRLKARIAERNSSIDVEWPQGLSDGLVRDILAFPGIGTQRLGLRDVRPLSLRECSVRELARLHETIASRWLASSQGMGAPFCWQGDNYSAAGHILDVECDRLAEILEDIAREMQSREAASDDERDERLLVLMRQELECNGRLHDPALLAELTTAWGA